MKKVFFLIAVFSFLLYLNSGCSSVGSGSKDNNYKSIEDLVKHFDANGLRVQKIQPSVFKAIKASDGCQLTINGAEIEIYRYDTSIPEQKEKLKNVTKTGYIEIVKMNFNARVNGSFIMLHWKKHPDSVKLVEVFDSF